MNKALFFIALVPPPAIRARVRALKRAVHQDVGAKHALKSPAHITLQMPFRLPPTQATALYATLTDVAAHEPGIDLRLDGFDVFAPRVLFIRVHPHPPIQEVHDRLRQRLQHDLGLDLPHPHQPIHPHVTIATRDLSREALATIWPMYRDRPFSATFTAKHLTLLKHNGRHWEVHRRFEMGIRES